MYELLQRLRCTVVRPENKTASYEVLIQDDNITASLVCTEPLLAGDEVIGMFGSYKDGIYLLAIAADEFYRMRELNKIRMKIQ